VAILSVNIIFRGIRKSMRVIWKKVEEQESQKITDLGLLFMTFPRKVYLLGHPVGNLTGCITFCLRMN